MNFNNKDILADMHKEWKLTVRSTNQFSIVVQGNISGDAVLHVKDIETVKNNTPREIGKVIRMYGKHPGVTTVASKTVFKPLFGATVVAAKKGQAILYFDSQYILLFAGALLPQCIVHALPNCFLCIIAKNKLSTQQRVNRYTVPGGANDEKYLLINQDIKPLKYRSPPLVVISTVITVMPSSTIKQKIGRQRTESNQ